MGGDFISSLTYDELARLENAARIVDSKELLIWYSAARNETIPQTRLYFTKILAGMDPDAEPPKYPEMLFDEKAEARQKAAASAKAKSSGNGSGSGSRVGSIKDGDTSRRRDKDGKDSSKRKRTDGASSAATSH